VVISLERGANGPADAIPTPSYLAPVKSRMVCVSGAGLPRSSWKEINVVIICLTSFPSNFKLFF